MRKIGTIVRLQVQLDSIKTDMKPYEQYTPVPNLKSVPKLRLDDAGVHGIATDGQVLPDVHNREHPHSKYRGNNGISIGFTSHYNAMRTRFGCHLTNGIAGESILVDTTEMLALESIEHGVVIIGNGREVHIGPWLVAHPCAPFSRFCLQFPEQAKPDKRITEALQFLDDGMRGFVAVYPEEFGTAEICLGDVVYTLDEPE